MMLFRILKLFGIDIPARMAEVRIDLEERFDLAKNSVQQAAQTTAVLAMLFSSPAWLRWPLSLSVLLRSIAGCRAITANSMDLPQSVACCS
jgi:hypothetical protein